ncbi:hypothetical protein LJC07_05055 [Christensenellaceae bacterium OttesenSCG-928-L17]|nr:hypothetical protein [Christensenellaceae bacterium OttesenSCG-928-L17]
MHGTDTGNIRHSLLIGAVGDYNRDGFLELICLESDDGWSGNNIISYTFDGNAFQFAYYSFPTMDSANVSYDVRIGYQLVGQPSGYALIECDPYDAFSDADTDFGFLCYDSSLEGKLYSTSHVDAIETIMHNGQDMLLCRQTVYEPGPQSVRTNDYESADVYDYMWFALYWEENAVGEEIAFNFFIFDIKPIRTHLYVPGTLRFTAV